MAFVQAMNTPDLKKIGVNGTEVYTEEGVGDYRVTLFTMLNRGLEASYIEAYVEKIFSRGVPAEIEDLFVMAFQTRDIRGGKGEKLLFYYFFKSLYLRNEAVVKRLLSLVPEYGCWRDMWELLKYVPELEENIFYLAKQTYVDDLAKCTSDQAAKMSLLAKWLPREKSKVYSGVARRLANYFYNFEESERKRIVKYRKDVSMMNKALNTVEINMCGKTWGTIKPEAVPGRCLKNHKKAFLNEPLKKKEKSELRLPEDKDRMTCRQHFLDFIESLKTGEKKAHGANVVMPHELVITGLSGKTSETEHEINQGQWVSIREETLKLGGLGKCVPMCDFSGSMDGTPKFVSLALGILISEINHEAFKDHILTFDSEPKWHSFKERNSLKHKLQTLGQIGQGTSTNFFKACMRIIEKMKAHRVPVGEEPDDLIVLTDMGFDEASKCAYSYQKSGNHSQIEKIRNAFRVAGEEVWGAGNGWKEPRIVIWNLRAEYKDFHAKAHQEGVVQLSGWSPAILRALQKGGVRVKTPYEGMREILDDERYNPVREAVSRA